MDAVCTVKSEPRVVEVCVGMHDFVFNDIVMKDGRAILRSMPAGNHDAGALCRAMSQMTRMTVTIIPPNASERTFSRVEYHPRSSGERVVLILKGEIVTAAK